MSDRDYQHSRILDVHRWSDHPEANKFVDEIYASFLNNNLQENIPIKKKHLKVVLLDLYVGIKKLWVIPEVLQWVLRRQSNLLC